MSVPNEVGNSWWDRNFSRNDFKSWLGDEGSHSRSVVVGLVRTYKTVLDCACGTCLDYERYKRDGVGTVYKGVDSCRGLVDEAKSRGIDVDFGDIENLEYKNHSFDVVTARHILEHLPDFEKALREMIRVAKYEVIVVFFLPPQEKEILQTDVNLNNEVNVNIYSRERVEAVAKLFGRLEWIPVGSEVVLRIMKYPKKPKEYEKVGVVCTLYIDNDTAYKMAVNTIKDIRRNYKVTLYARITKLDQKYEKILELFDHIAKNRSNLLARSWNEGIKKALKDGNRYVIVPNLDIKLEDGCITNLVEFAKEDDSIMWSGRCTNTKATYPSGNFEVDSKTFYDNYAFFMVDKKLFEGVGEFDENFKPCYGEDVDMQYRIELAGKKHTCVYHARFLHYGQVTVGTSKDWKGKDPNAVDKYFIRKWGGKPRRQIFTKPFGSDSSDGRASVL